MPYRPARKKEVEYRGPQYFFRINTTPGIRKNIKEAIALIIRCRFLNRRPVLSDNDNKCSLLNYDKYLWALELLKTL